MVPEEEAEGGGFQAMGRRGLLGMGPGPPGAPQDEAGLTRKFARRVGGLLGVAGRLSGTVSPFRAE